MKDADEARKAVSSHGTMSGNQAALKYEDQINDASTILGWRRRNPDWQRHLSANLKLALRELAARSGRIVEFGDGGADETVLAALRAVASADETPAQRAMLLKRGLIEMVKGQVVINERGYDMMKKAGVPPKLTPEERREEIAGTEEKRLSRF